MQFYRRLTAMIVLLLAGQLLFGQAPAVSQFVLKYRDVKQMVLNDGNTRDLVGRMEMAVSGKMMKVTSETRPGVFTEVLHDLNAGTITSYSHDATDYFYATETKLESKLFSYKRVGNGKVSTRLIDEKRMINGFNCSRAEVDVNGEKMDVWYSDTARLQPEFFENPLLKDIPGLPVVIGFEDNNISIPGLNGMYRLYMLDSFSTPDDMTDHLIVKNKEKFELVEDFQSRTERFRAMFSRSQQERKIDPDMLAFIPGRH